MSDLHQKPTYAARASRLAERLENLAAHLRRLQERGIELDAQARLTLEDSLTGIHYHATRAGRQIDPLAMQHLAETQHG